jgi:hypothetical protein
MARERRAANWAANRAVMEWQPQAWLVVGSSSAILGAYRPVSTSEGAQGRVLGLTLVIVRVGTAVCSEKPIPEKLNHCEVAVRM